MKRLYFLCALVPILANAGEVTSPAALVREIDVVTDSMETALDLRSVYIAGIQPTDPALKDLTYSAVGWDLAEDGSEGTVRIVAESGSLVNGLFVPDGAETVTVASGLTGRGTVDWTDRSPSERIFRLKHEVSEGGLIVNEKLLYGYLKLENRGDVYTQQEMESAAFAEATHLMTLVADAERPWTPVDRYVAQSGLQTPEDLQSGESTETSVRFSGSGKFFYALRVADGQLEVLLDGEIVATSSGCSWTDAAIDIPSSGAHTVSFRFVGTLAGGAAVLRGLRWMEASDDVLASDEITVSFDLREGVRVLPGGEGILPIQYSPTNWVGGIGTSLSPTSRVSVVRLAADSGEIVDWAPRPETARVIVDSTEEGEIAWRATGGVWMMKFEITDESGEILHEEEAYFDLRAPGFMLFFQ